MPRASPTRAALSSRRVSNPCPMRSPARSLARAGEGGVGGSWREGVGWGEVVVGRPRWCEEWVSCPARDRNSVGGRRRFPSAGGRLLAARSGVELRFPTRFGPPTRPVHSAGRFRCNQEGFRGAAPRRGPNLRTTSLAPPPLLGEALVPDFRVGPRPPRRRKAADCSPGD
jgi:hypothetical protein